VLRRLTASIASDVSKAGEVPGIQYYLADESHVSILGNVV